MTKDLVKKLDTDPSKMRVTFIPTAAEVEKGDLQWLKDDRQALVHAGFQVTDFTLTNKTPVEVSKMLDTTDFVFISGGNTFYLLQEMRKSDFDTLIIPFLENGGLYGGASAGSVVAGPDISFIALLDDPSFAPDLQDYRGLGLTDVSIFPHWGSEQFQKKYKAVMESCYKKGLKIILLTDDQYLLYENSTYRIEST
ncbi:Type 1 glutamine amidotransferase-like domain-containing protein [Candidatus Woesebacteria bacterium]|nr:Type 1 glutamine amidotransferase-like domain-containing protein [Candidatus Woesebacteria bacterium]